MTRAQRKALRTDAKRAGEKYQTWTPFVQIDRTKPPQLTPATLTLAAKLQAQGILAH